MFNIIAKIESANVSGVTVSFPAQKIEGVLGTYYNPTVLLSEILKPYNGKLVDFGYKLFNSIADIERKVENAHKKNKNISLNQREGRLRVCHGQRTTDIDDWFESSVELQNLEFSKKGNLKSSFPTSTFDLYEALEKNEAKFILIQVKEK